MGVINLGWPMWFRVLTVLAIGVAAAVARADEYETLFDNADRVAVVDHRHAEAPDGVLYESAAAADLESLRHALRATAEPILETTIWGRGGPAPLEIHLYLGTERLASFGYLGSMVSGEPWEDDAYLVDHEALLRWFDARGVDGPRTEEREWQQRWEQYQRDEERFLAAMPDALRPLWAAEWDAIRREPYVQARPAWSAALEEQVPDRVERAAVLLAWYGSGRWGTSGPGAYEAMAEKLVLEVPPGDLAVAIQEQADVEAVLEGAARLACGQQLFSEADVAFDLPEYLQRLLRDHVLKSPDEGKRACAEDALAPR